MVFGIAVAVLDATWQFSVHLVPVILLALAGIAAWATDDLVAAAVRSQQVLTVRYGLALVAGLVAGGVVSAAAPGIGGLAAGAVIVAVAGWWAVERHGTDVDPLPLEGWRDRARLAWLALPVLAVAALASGDLLLKHVVAVLFYSTIFWEI